jgi:N6-L-threonylcarbamoyladenine synthase
MIGWASMHRFLAGDTDDYSIMIRPKWSIDESADVVQTES